MNITIDEKLDWDKLALDGCVYLKNDYPEIWLNNGVSEPRQNFTLAHELGHIVNDILPDVEKYINPIKDDYDTLYRSGVSPMERKANDFAARLLMPSDFIANEAKKLTESEDFEQITLEDVIKRLASRFRVSYDAMKWRLVNLGYVKKR
ncbi:ImmA/IrrE family metallo-endopeptidase [Helicobacter sp. 13S00482-2]|uniref:ImmA/IrrE family metallo-endopeptidase n=1 Tax=Helicobacter sp. 13S00482-2 TaxID=1476200 RepID=UPI0015DA2FC9|nr:ImmA/IrrE family metallo-endopeptidase [Helicobacter sp. 13S00482-2]